MSCKVKEISNGYIVPNPTTQGIPVSVDLSKDYSTLTVFNEADQPIRVSYRNTDGDTADFVIPKNGRTFTRNINGVLLNTSLKVTALNNNATGNVIINLGN